MVGKKLIQIIRSFSTREFNQFGKFVRSSYFNENTDLVKLYDALSPHYPFLESEAANLNREKIWQQIYKNRPFEDIVLRRLTSQMTRLAEDFLRNQEMEKCAAAGRRLLLRGLKNKNLNRHFADAMNKKNAIEGKSTDYHYDQLQSEIIRHEMKDLYSPEKNTLANLAAADAHLECYYWIKKLKFYCSLLSYKSVRVINRDLDISEEKLGSLLQSSAFGDPVIQVYYKTVCLLKGLNAEDNLEDLLQMLIQYESLFPGTELQQIYFYAQNFCAGEINNGRRDYYKKLFDLYRTMIERKILPGTEDLKVGVYKNILTLGLMLEEFDWTENFIQNYTEKLPAEHRENAENYNLAKVYFHKKEYEKVIEQLREVEYKELVYALGGKLMLLKTYYELQETRSLESLIDSFRIYLRRNKLISKNVRQQYMNSLRFTKKLANVAPYDYQNLQKVKEQIEKCRALAAKQWLLEKIAKKEK